MLSILYSTTLYLPGPAPPPWRFDTVSALIGAATALLLTGLAYRYRDTLRQGGEAIAAPLKQLYDRMEASVEDRYRELIAARARSLLIPTPVTLDDVFIEPTLLASAPPPQSTSAAESPSTTLQDVPLRGLLKGHPKLAILSDPGAGKTTLLAYIALAYAHATRETREENKSEPATRLEIDRERLPLYVFLPAIDWNEKTSNDERDQASDATPGIDELLNAATAIVKGSRGMTRRLRQYLEAGRAIVLADGWDTLSPQQRQPAAAWLNELINALPGNLWLVGTGTRGYAPLTEIGFVPLTLGAWNTRQVEQFAKRRIQAHASEAGGQVSPLTTRKLTTQLRRAIQKRESPLELALRAFVYLSTDQSPAQRSSLFDRAFDLLLPPEEQTWSPQTCRSVLGQLALSLQQEDRVIADREEVEALIEAALPLPEERPKRAATHVFRALTGERGLLRPVDPHRYTFAHPLWQAYFAARQLTTAEPDTLPEQLEERLDDPRWAEVLRFYAESGDMGPLVATWLRTPDDVFRTRLRTLGAWVGAAPEEATWRNGAMAVLARGFLQPGLHTQVRQALAKTLAATGVPGVTYLFRQALGHPEAEVRVAAVIGLVRTAGEADLPALEAALADEETAVHETLVRELAHMGTDAAVRWLAQLLLEADERLSLAAAEALAQCGEEAATFLREAADSEDVLARRAAVYGLAQIGARDVLERIAREDQEWIVRSAASAALEELEQREQATGVAPPPEIEQLPWLISWAAAQGEGVGLDEAARRMLTRALNDDDAAVRIVAAKTLAQMGRPEDVEPLQSRLKDPDPAVASAALTALAEISKRYDLSTT